MAPAADAVVERTNAFRETQGLEPVSVEPALERAAREFARFMAKTGQYGHAADGRRPPQRATAQGYEYCIVSENIAYRYRSRGYDTPILAREMAEGWKQSPEHARTCSSPPSRRPASASLRAKTAATRLPEPVGGVEPLRLLGKAVPEKLTPP